MEKPFQHSNAKRFLRFTAAGMAVVIVVALIPAMAGAQTHLWSQRFGGSDFDECRGAAFDAAGNIVTAGWFGATVDFGGGALTCAGLRDIYVAKYDAAGNHQWSRGFGSIGYDEAWSVAVDRSNNVIVTGLFGRTVDFGGGPLTSAGEDDIFVAKYDGAGNHLWSRRYGSRDDDVGWDIAVDWADNILLTGAIEGTVDLGGGPLAGAGFADIFVAKYDAAGNHIWSDGYGSAAVDIGCGITFDHMDNVLVTGYFGNTVDFGGGPLTSVGSSDIFVAKYDPAGNHVWSYSYGGSSYDAGEDIAVDGADNVVVTGNFGGTVDFGGGLLTSAGSGDIFVAEYDFAGSHLWSRRAGGVDGDKGMAIAVDPADDVLLTGFFRGTVDFGGGPLNSAGAWEIFMVKYDAAGSHVWSHCFGNTQYDCGYGIAVDPFGNLLVTGFFRQTVDFGGGPLVSAGSEDIFLAKYAPGPTGIGDRPEDTHTNLHNYPNPFNPVTHIVFVLDAEAHVNLAIYDSAGRLVRTLVDRRVGPGMHSEAWDGRDAIGKPAASGVYFCRLEAGHRTLARKAVLLK
jgi:hypothetical protein